MARVVIRVEREGGSVVKIEEQSAMPLFTDEQTGRLVQEAFLRTLGALGVTLAPPPQSQPDPGGSTAPRPEAVLTPAQAEKLADTTRDDTTDRKAA